MRNNSRNLSVTLLGALLLAGVHARELPYDITMCHAITFSPLMTGKDLSLFGYEGRGITMSNTEDKAMDNVTYHCLGVMRVAAGVLTQNGYCKFVSTEGDSFVGEYTHSGPPGTEARWAVMQGTGKWTGIKGGGPYRQVTRGTPVTPGTGQACNNATGSYLLPD
jgi:hypothetical protein